MIEFQVMEPNQYTLDKGVNYCSRGPETLSCPKIAIHKTKCIWNQRSQRIMLQEPIGNRIMTSD